MLKPTSITVAMNLRLQMAGAARGSQYNTYPNGAGTRPVLAPCTEEMRRHDAARVAEVAAQFRELYPAVYERWQAACVAAQDAVDPTAFV